MTIIEFDSVLRLFEGKSHIQEMIQQKQFMWKTHDGKRKAYGPEKIRVKPIWEST